MDFRSEASTACCIKTRILQDMISRNALGLSRTSMWDPHVRVLLGATRCGGFEACSCCAGIEPGCWQGCRMKNTHIFRFSCINAIGQAPQATSKPLLLAGLSWKPKLSPQQARNKVYLKAKVIWRTSEKPTIAKKHLFWACCASLRVYCIRYTMPIKRILLEGQSKWGIPRTSKHPG